MSPYEAWPDDEALQPAGDPGAAVRVDDRVLVLGRGLSGVQHTFQAEEQVDQVGVGAGPYRGRSGDVARQGRGRAGLWRRRLGELGEVGELPGSTGS